jgi:hypothetical protein
MRAVDIGVAYRHNEEYFLAISESEFLTVREGRLRSVAAIMRALPRYNLSCKQLCEIWGTDYRMLDEVSREYLMSRLEKPVSEPCSDQLFQRFLTVTQHRKAG